ncbi:MAG: hypothetical protein VB100_07385 [Angelakisella sp.]|nr:hypothetical protein [Angelakisella sp.]
MLKSKKRAKANKTRLIGLVYLDSKSHKINLMLLVYMDVLKKSTVILSLILKNTDFYSKPI